MQRMFNPPHPGELLREDVLPALLFPASCTAMLLFRLKWPCA